jgi:putative ABC transport system permease protein
MLGYYLRLALRSFARNPGLTALMVFAIGLGISVCVMTLTVYNAMAGNPIWWKNDRLYTVTMDSWAVERPPIKERPQFPPMQLTYRDSEYLFASDIPARKILSYKTPGVVVGGENQRKPLPVQTRVTTADFFPMFDVPFQYGSPWNAKADTGPEPVIVLSHGFNQKLFGGANSVGSTLRWNNRDYRIVGVMDRWRPQPKFYDIIGSPFDEPEDVFLPFGWTQALEMKSGNLQCWKFEPINTFKDVQGSECVWIQMWVELPTAEAREKFAAFVDAYWAEQRKSGRFQRPRNNRLTNVGQWLADHEVVQDDNRLLVYLAFAFLGVCLINTVGLLLAKFLNGAPVSGVRRALGASRASIFVQHLTEVGLLAAAGSLVGIVLSALGLWGVRVLYVASADGSGAYNDLAHFNLTSLGWAIVLAVAAAILAGLYPAWRIGRLTPASYLKSQ